MENKLRAQCIPSVPFNRKMVVDTKNTFLYLKKIFYWAMDESNIPSESSGF